MVQNVKFSNVLGWPVADHPDFSPYVLLFSRLFWPWLVRVFQNRVILTLGIFEVLILRQNVEILQCPGLAGRRPSRFPATRPYDFKTFLAVAGPGLSKSVHFDFRRF